MKDEQAKSHREIRQSRRDPFHETRVMIVADLAKEYGFRDDG